MTTRENFLTPIDLAREQTEYTSAIPRTHLPWLPLAAIVVACLAVGIGLGYGMAGRHQPPQLAPSSPAEVARAWTVPVVPRQPDGAVSAVTLAQAERTIEVRLAGIALQEAYNAVGQGVRGGREVQQAVAEAPLTGEVPMRIEASQGTVRVRVEGREVAPVARDIYRVHRSQPVQVEFSPPTGLSREEYFELVVTPVLRLEQYDPYPPPHHH